MIGGEKRRASRINTPLQPSTGRTCHCIIVQRRQLKVSGRGKKSVNGLSPSTSIDVVYEQSPT